jgi:hypothetical protein
MSLFNGVWWHNIVLNFTCEYGCCLKYFLFEKILINIFFIFLKLFFIPVHQNNQKILKNINLKQIKK